MTRSSAESPAVPGEGLLHPLALAAVALLLLNDHVLKAAFPSWWTGKLSDLAGLAFFPLFLQALWEWGRAALGKFDGHSSRVLLAATVATALVFALVKTWTPATGAYEVVWGVLGWPLSAARALLAGTVLPRLGRAHLVTDATDLLALPGLAVALLPGPALQRRRSVLPRGAKARAETLGRPKE